MLFSISLYVALVIFGIGICVRIASWFRYRIGNEAQAISSGERVSAAISGTLRVIFSTKILTLIKVFFLDVLFQRKVLKEDVVRWIMHMCIFYGFMLLLLMHALENFISVPLFTNYYATVNPFLFLRNLFGALVILGLVIAIGRRMFVPGMRQTTRPMDIYLVALVGIILVSGIFLEATKIVSHTSFQEMVDEWAVLDDDELESLKAYWAADFGVVFPEPVAARDSDALEMGKEAHEMSCASCHSKPTWAFLSYGVSKGISPIAVTLTNARSQVWLWYLHFLASFVALAYLPFSKLFHMLSSPVSLFANAVMDPSTSATANVLTRRAMELDACTHCAACSLHCSVGVVFRQIPNETILPSEKLISLKAMASGKQLDDKELRRIQQGSYICTSCYRCTSVCPVGINLQDLWLSMREDLLREGYPENAAWARRILADRLGGQLRDKEATVTPAAGDLQKDMTVSLQAETFSSCFECQTCTNVCPVVNNYENPRETLGLLPHQIMHSLGLGLENEALGNQMIWDCLTCYMCQEHCPQGVQVTDVLYELKNRAYTRLTEEEG